MRPNFHEDGEEQKNNGGVMGGGQQNLNLNQGTRANMNGSKSTEQTINRNKRIVFSENPKLQNGQITKNGKKNLYGNMYGNV